MNIQAKTKKIVPEYAVMLRQAREQKRLRQTTVAKKIGVSPMMLSFMERGQREPKLSTLEAWLDIFGLEIKIDFKTPSHPEGK